MFFRLDALMQQIIRYMDTANAQIGKQPSFFFSGNNIGRLFINKGKEKK